MIGMTQVGGAAFDQLKQSPMYQAWSQVAPDREAFPDQNHSYEQSSL